MQKNDAKKFANSLGVLAEVMGKELSPLAIGAYFKSLERFAVDQVEKAISQAIVECTFFPKPAELIKFITGGSQNLADAAMLQAGVAINSAKRVGKYQSVKFDDPVTAAVISECFGGWVKFCTDLTENNEVWVRKDFEKAYQVYCRNNMTHAGHLPGVFEIENDYAGYSEHIPDPVLIDTTIKRKQIGAR